MADAAISVRGISKSFGDVEALVDVDLEAPRGMVLGLLGPNGAGKTTLVRVLTTLLKPDAGTASVVGLDVVRDAAKLREQIGLAGQYAAVDENLTGLENLTMVGRLYGTARRAAKARGQELLERFDLVDAANRPTKTYSGGMRRRLDLAAALVAKPPVLFLDEPTTGLDPRSRLSLWDVIEELVGEGTTVLLTTQYLDEADRLADTIAVIDHGRLIAEGTPDELKDRVGGERLEVTLDDRADAEPAVRALAPMSDDGPPTVDGLVVCVHVRQRRGSIVEAVRRLSDAGVGVDDLALRRPTLDDVFLTLTGHAAEENGSSEDGSGDDGPRGRRVRRLVTDTLVIAERNLVRLPRAPDLLLAFTVQPIMFVLLFRYVFGGAISTPGYSYVDFLIPGIIVQNIAFGGFVTALGLNEDVHKGLIDRFRSLPMARPAVLAGRTLADVVTNALSMTILLDHRPDHRLLVPDQRRRGDRRVRAAAAVRLRVLVGVRVPRAARVHAGGRELGRLHRGVPADVHLLGVRAGRLDARAAAGRSPKSTRSRSWSTRCAPCGWARPRATTCGGRSCGRWRSSPCSRRWRWRAIGARQASEEVPIAATVSSGSSVGGECWQSRWTRVA